MRLASTLCLSLFAVVVGCGSSSSEFDENGDETGGGGANGDRGLLGAEIGDDGAGGPGSISRDAACATGSAVAKRGVAYLTFQFDRSGSMGDVNSASSKISVCKNVLRDFFSDPASKGLSASLSLFPHRSGGSVLCGTSDYAAPVTGGAMQALPSTALATAASEITTVSGTPTLPALKGAHELAASVSASNGGAKVAVVLVTDGSPSGCSSSVENVAEYAASVRETAPTYVIGIGNLGNLNEIAQAGSGRDAFLVDTSNPDLVQQQFREALDAVRALSASCDLELPSPPDGQTLDINKVNVLVTAKGKETSPAYDAACAGEGWHYDDPKSPKQVKLCPTTCQKLQDDPDAKVDVIFGCATSGPAVR